MLPKRLQEPTVEYKRLSPMSPKERRPENSDKEYMHIFFKKSEQQ